jgi:spermidine/putrescine transport system permease protein
MYLPIVVLIVTSFNASRFGGRWEGFSLMWYERLLQEPTIWHAFINSLIVAAYSSLSATVIGTTAAVALHRYQSRFQAVHRALLLSPLVMPDILMGICLLFLFVSLTVKLSLLTVFLAHTTFSISYVAMIVRTRLDVLDPSIIEASKDLGASSFQTFWRVLLPLLAPAIIAGWLLAFTLSIDDFVITFFVVGPGATTLPVYIYSMMKFGSPPVIHALSTLMLVTTAIITSLYYRFTEEVSR